MGSGPPPAPQNLDPDMRVGDIQKRFLRAELGKPRITFQSGSNGVACFAEVEAGVAPLVLPRLASQDRPLQVRQEGGGGHVVTGEVR